jgi:hypothetical protein
MKVSIGARGLGNVRDFIEEVTKIIARQADGFFTVAEAAAILAESPAGGEARGWREKMYAAWHTGDLIIRDTTRTKKAPKATKRDFMDLMKESDLDAWLENDGAGYLFPKAPAEALAVAVHKLSGAQPTTASIGTVVVWTEARKAEARAYRSKHGLKRTAAHYGVSQATISKHIPAGKSKPLPLGPWAGLKKK